MIIRNKLDKTFGPFGGSTGFFLFIGGLAGIWVSPYCIIIAIIGAFAAFTSTSCFIDTEKRKLKFSNDLFGIIPAGKWITPEPGMRLGLERSHKGYRAYIRGNQPVGIHTSDIRIGLFEKDGDKIMDIKKFSDRESAKEGLKELCTILDLPQAAAEMP